MIKYDGRLKKIADDMRNNLTLSEQTLWEMLRKDKLGVRFLRQRPLLGFIVDFYCAKLRLVIEVDGSSHDNKHEYDQERDNELIKQNILILHFSDEDVIKHINEVKRIIVEKIKERIKSPLTPLYKEGNMKTDFSMFSPL